MSRDASDSSPPTPEEVNALREEVRALRDALVQSEKMSSLGVLSASITHEFNNVLTTVINYAKMGLRHEDEAVRNKAFDRILAAGQRAARITTGMLALSRGGSDRQEPTSLPRLLEDVLVLVSKDLAVHRVHVEQKIDGDPWAAVSATQIQQVLINLIVNARQASDAGATLTLRVSSSPDRKWSEIAIRDTGSGIPDDVLPRIFEPFYTTKERDAEGKGGTGLGLALCRDIMESHRGRIRVESAVGKGTCFTLRFPAVEAPSQLLKAE